MAHNALHGLTVSELRELARKDAADVLATYWTTGVLPVDPVPIARDLGLSVFSAELKNDTFGMLVGRADGAQIFVDRDQPSVRFRFTCAHELGHYVLRAEEVAGGASFVDRRSDVDKGTADEIYANEFAGSLLMPRAELSAAVKEGKDDFELARQFDVSLAAIRYRRQILGV